MRPLTPFLLIPFVLAACHSAPAPVAGLSPTAIYSIDSVRVAYTGGDEKAARRLFLAAMDAYKNKKNIPGSIGLFKKSILLKPTAQAYYEMGGALIDQDSCDEAISALNIAEKLQYKPMANVLFRLSAAWIGSEGKQYYNAIKDSAALHYMEVALQMGYSHPDEFLKSPWFTQYPQVTEFKRLYNTVLAAGSNVKDPEQSLWQEFKNEFVPVSLPLTINDAWISSHTMDKTINFDYEKFVPEMRTAKFSRDVDREYYYYAILKADATYTALLYAGKNAVFEGDHKPIFFFLVTFDPSGKIIDKLAVAGQQTLADPVKVFTMQPNFEFEVKDFKNIYKNDPDSVGYDSNAIIRTDPAAVANYRIAASGKFEKTNAPLAVR